MQLSQEAAVSFEMRIIGNGHLSISLKYEEKEYKLGVVVDGAIDRAMKPVTRKTDLVPK